VLDPYVDDEAIEGVAVLMTTVAAPVDLDGRTVAVVGVDLKLTELRERLASLTPVEGGSVSIVAGSGVVVALSHPICSGPRCRRSISSHRCSTPLASARRCGRRPPIRPQVSMRS
jgi:hypothetical protein